MATAPDNAASAPAKRKYDTAALMTTASWGIGAAAALFLAVLAGLSDYGTRRITTAVSHTAGKTQVAEEIDKTRKSQKGAALQIPASKPVAVMHIKLPSSPQLEQVAQIQPPPLPQVQAKAEPKPEPSEETRRLQEQLRRLVAEQDRLVQRLSALERNLDDVTGSIRRQQTELKEEITARTAAPAPVPSGPVSTISWPAIVTAIATSGSASNPPTDDSSPEVTASIPPKTPLPPQRPAENKDENVKPSAEAAASDSSAKADATPETKPAEAPQSVPPKRITHGIDLGGAASVERLRVMWRGLQANEAMLLQGLRPVAFMSGTRRGQPDVRLIAGPIANASEAAKLCSALLTAGRYCEPAVYAGHRLSLR